MSTTWLDTCITDYTDTSPSPAVTICVAYDEIRPKTGRNCVHVVVFAAREVLRAARRTLGCWGYDYARQMWKLTFPLEGMHAQATPSEKCDTPTTSLCSGWSALTNQRALCMEWMPVRALVACQLERICRVLKTLFEDEKKRCFSHENDDIASD